MSTGLSRSQADPAAHKSVAEGALARLDLPIMAMRQVSRAALQRIVDEEPPETVAPLAARGRHLQSTPYARFPLGPILRLAKG